MGSIRGILELATLRGQQFRSEDRPMQGPRAPSGAPRNPTMARRRLRLPLKRPSIVMLCTIRSIIGSIRFHELAHAGPLATSLSVVSVCAKVNTRHQANHLLRILVANRIREHPTGTAFSLTA